MLKVSFAKPGTNPAQNEEKTAALEEKKRNEETEL